MIFSKEIDVVIEYFKTDKAIGTVAFCILLLSLITCFVLSPFSALVIVLSYLLGLILCGILLKYQKQVKVFIENFTLLYERHFQPPRKTGEVLCSICNGPKCTRHKHNAKTPWKNFYVDKTLNDSVERLFDHILDEFVVSWYTNISNQNSFINELKYSLRYSLASATKRFLKLDIGRIVANRLIPCGIKHVDDYLCMQQIVELTNSDMKKVAVDYLGKRLHVAASSRNNEIKYLQSLSGALSERLLPADNLKCKNFTILLREILSGWVLLPLMDVLADPNIINYLTILITTYKPKKHILHNDSKNRQVEILENYSKIEQIQTTLAVDLQSIIRNQNNFYFLLQFLKKEGSVHLLNFYLDIEAFNESLLKPDLTKKQLEMLHGEALKIYKDYMDPNCENFIGCSLDIVIELKTLLDLGVYKVAKLQTAEPLYKASEYALEVIENEWIPLFYHSTEFYMMICGSKHSNNYTKSSGATSPFITQGSPSRLRQQKRPEGSPGAVSKISNSFGKIRGALQAKQPVDGAIYPNSDWIPESDAAYVETLPEISCSIRDLSTWKIYIPAVETHQYGSKPICIFNINVHRADLNKQWIIKRRDQDFYTLKAKLMEFHGEQQVSYVTLPSRRSIVNIDVRKQSYEDFLKSLLEQPLLRGSDLLHTFLTAQQNFTMLVTAPMPFVDLENIYQSVAYKLRKEKGQHLDGFMNAYLNSTGHTKPVKFEWAEFGDELDSTNSYNSIVPKTRTNRIFDNNFGVAYRKDVCGSSSSINPNGITESLFYLLKYIFKVPNAILKLYVAICSVAQQAVESMCRGFLERKIKSALPPSTLAFLLNQLEDVIFADHIAASEEELRQRKERAFKEAQQVFPHFLNALFGKNLNAGFGTILKVLQDPLCNKQLAYNLVDIVIAEMYPELDTSDEFY